MPTIAPAPAELFDTSASRLREFAALLLLLLAGFCLLTVVMLAQMRREVRHNAERTAENLLSVQAEEIDRTLALFVADMADAAEAARTTDGRRDFGRAHHAAGFGTIRVFDADGAAVLGTDADASPPTAAERAALGAARRARGEGVTLGAVYASGRGHYAVTISRRLSAPDGRFAGGVVGTVDLGLFFDQFRGVHLGKRDFFTLLAEDGTLLAHLPDNRYAGRSLAGGPLLARFDAARRGAFAADAQFDHLRRAFTFQHTTNWPLLLVVAQSTHDLYRAWDQRAAVAAVLLGVLATFTVLLLRLLRRDLRLRRAAASALSASETRYRRLAECSADLIVLADRDMVRTYVSPASRQFGYEPADMLGICAADFVHPDDRAAYVAAIRRVLDEETAVEVTYRLRNANGVHTWVESRIAPTDNGYMAILRDIDRRRRDEMLQEERSEALAVLATTDGLTGLSNRRTLDEALARACAEHDRAGRSLSLLMIDVDHFKRFNDAHGHQAGDAVLVRVAQVISRHTKRAGDVAARYGGEEFAVLLPGADMIGAIEVGEAIRAALWDLAIDHAGSPLARVTVSIGVATAPPGAVEASGEALLKAADDELYRSKQNGRNRVHARPLVAETVAG